MFRREKQFLCWTCFHSSSPWGPNRSCDPLDITHTGVGLPRPSFTNGRPAVHRLQLLHTRWIIYLNRLYRGDKTIHVENSIIRGCLRGVIGQIVLWMEIFDILSTISPSIWDRIVMTQTSKLFISTTWWFFILDTFSFDAILIMFSATQKAGVNTSLNSWSIMPISTGNPTSKEMHLKQLKPILVSTRRLGLACVLCNSKNWQVISEYWSICTHGSVAVKHDWR